MFEILGTVPVSKLDATFRVPEEIKDRIRLGRKVKGLRSSMLAGKS
jgi:hypothetical protein